MSHLIPVILKTIKDTDGIDNSGIGMHRWLTATEYDTTKKLPEHRTT
jgi:hypothetical protein